MMIMLSIVFYFRMLFKKLTHLRTRMDLWGHFQMRFQVSRYFIKLCIVFV